MTTVNDVFQTLCAAAPLELQMDFDNSGFLVGHKNASVSKVLLALDVTDEVIDEAIHEDVDLIVSHHPLIFHPLRSATDDTPEGRRILRLIEHRIALICMHTNLDIAEGGVNDVLMAALNAQTEGALDDEGCGRIGVLDAKVKLQDFVLRVKNALHCRGLRYADAGREVYRLAVMGGSGADCLERAAELGCDTYVTADVKYHQFQKACDLGLNLIDADHFYTENPIVPVLADLLTQKHQELQILVSAAHQAIVHFA